MVLKSNKKNAKLYYSIGQVAEHADLPQSVLRYWETVFSSLKPAKSKGGSRQFSDEDVDLILQIKDLLYNKGFTIKGANAQLNTTAPNLDRVPRNSTQGTPATDNQPINSADISTLIGKLKELIHILED